jgi:hypothetical protein
MNQVVRLLADICPAAATKQSTAHSRSTAYGNVVTKYQW